MFELHLSSRRRILEFKRWYRVGAFLCFCGLIRRRPHFTVLLLPLLEFFVLFCLTYLFLGSNRGVDDLQHPLAPPHAPPLDLGLHLLSQLQMHKVLTIKIQRYISPAVESVIPITSDIFIIYQLPKHPNSHDVFRARQRLPLLRWEFLRDRGVEVGDGGAPRVDECCALALEAL